jgi:hypothetical protein
MVEQGKHKEFGGEIYYNTEKRKITLRWILGK